MLGLLWQQYQVLCFLLMLLYFQVIFSSFHSSSSAHYLCSPEESFALLHFKNSLSINSSASRHCDAAVSYSKTDSWNENSDCCSWDGITCDEMTGHVIRLDLSSSWLLGPLHPNSTLFFLRHLRMLNLACNDFSRSIISSKFGQFTKLTHLNLSFSNAKLQHLSFNQLVQNLTEMRYLFLFNVDMSSVVPSSLLNLSSSLVSLNLGNCGLKGKFPSDIFHFPFLQELTLVDNPLLRGYLPNFNWSSPLSLLDLSITQFTGKLPDTIGNLMNLKVLDLSYSYSEGSIPNSLWNLTGITHLDLKNNYFSGKVSASLSNLGVLAVLNLGKNYFSGHFPDVFGNLSKVTTISLERNAFIGQLPSSAFNLTQLFHFDFFGNQFVGQFPSHVSGFSHLVHLRLSNNFLNGRIPSWLFTLPSLRYLNIGHNNFTGPIDQSQRNHVDLSNSIIQDPQPNSTFELPNLIFLDFSSNNLSGTVKSDIFSKLKNLKFVDFSNNKLLSLTTHSEVNFTLPNLQVFKFSSCNVSQFPDFLRTSENLEELDISNNKITGQILQLEWPYLNLLNLSHNFLTSLERISAVNLQYLDLHSNLLQKPPLILSSNIILLSVAHNKLTGGFPSSFCNLSSTAFLNLSNNSLIGVIPQCLGNLGRLALLDLRKNHFHGSIPQIFSECKHLRTLNLNDNQLEGALPPSLSNCSYLEVLNVGNNMINDTFPHWTATIPKLQVLVLRSNHFHGPIYNHSSTKRIPSPQLRIIDLSRNGFTGVLPPGYFKNFKAMMVGENDDSDPEYMWSPGYDQYYTMTLTYKGTDLELERILEIFTTIDLSNNQFEGIVPGEVGNLRSLKLLNLSHNNLTGHIPGSFGNLTELESLDLSANRLVGGIPIELVRVTSLAVLNLSYNQLMGPIPQGNQFITFRKDSYFGNLGLCGQPLSQICSNNDEEPATFPEDDDTSSWFDWRIVVLGYGCGVVWGLSLGYLAFSIQKPRWLMMMFERYHAKARRRSRRIKGEINKANISLMCAHVGPQWTCLGGIRLEILF